MALLSSCIAVLFLVSLSYASDKEEKAIVAYLEKNTFSQGKAEYVFVLDRSGSVGATNFELQRGFVESFLTHVIVDVNASRVAVISYSATAECHIDYLREPKNKCILSQELQDVVYEKSGPTNTAEALEKARMVFQNARPNVKKVLVLISDGIANMGGDPITFADRLKAQDVEIFCFGIGRFIRPALTRLATSDQHVYSCAHFRDFRNLVRKIRGDSHETKWSAESFTPKCDHLCDSPYRGQPDDPGCCDHNARCSCALQSGMYTCVCLPGYYGLSGLPGYCRACPKGTYKSKMEPVNKCIHCPPGSTTENEASTRKSDCICKKGYEGDPHNGIPCTMIKCPPLQSPTHGHMFGNCDFSYESECYFQCEEGYELVDSESHTRTCQSNKEWSGKASVCRQIRCPPPPIPVFGSMSCDENLVVGNVCRFGCGTGYIMSGSPERKCLTNTKWSGMEVDCIPVECGLPPPLHHGDVSCRTDQRLTYMEVCGFACRPGFERVGPAYLVCNENGRLISVYQHREERPSCKDVTPPEIICPDPVLTRAMKGQNYARVDVSPPLCADNSGLQPKLRIEPKHVTFPREYPIGKHVVRFIAVDSVGLEAICDVNIVVYDDEAPSVVRCPSKVNATSDGVEEPVFWNEPLFEDNSKEPVTIIKSHSSGDKFGPGRHTVTYQALDAENNEAQCVFDVIVTRNTCPYHPAPSNGAFSCVDYWHGQICQAHCNEMHDFVEPPADYYQCTGDSTWETVPPDMPVPWPDCARPAIPVKIKKKLRGFYYQGNCHDPGVQLRIKKMFLANLESGFEQAALCVRKGVCNLESVSLVCGKTDDELANSKSRRRRDVWEIAEREELELEFEITIDVDQELNNTEEVLQQFLDTIQNLKWDSEDFEIQSQFTTTDASFTEPTTPNAESYDFQRYLLNFENETYAGSVVFTDENTELVCRPGSVLNNDRCVLCSPGTYFDGPSRACVDCPPGQYQHEEGRTDCELCPAGTGTENGRTRHVEECKRICQPGSHSATGLETCVACPSGTYQEFAGQTSCRSCPDGQTTAGMRSISVSDCNSICEAGSYSKTGLEPCDPCSKGFYQSLPGQVLCEECPANFSTVDEGSRNDSECLDLDPCSDTNFCLNGAACQRVGRTAECVCREGFEGVRCETDIDECQQAPCHNAGTCVNEDGGYRCTCTDGFAGKLCEEEVDECSSGPCLNNGTCMDKVNGYVCICPPSYGGRDCEEVRGNCSDACFHGECETNRCVCLPGYKGPDCSMEVDECENVTCLNNGSCVGGIASFKCVCEAGYTGTFCEVDIDDCEANNCSVASMCYDRVESYECVCPPGYSGTFCETKLDSDFILNFPDSSSTIANMATLTLTSALSDVTVSMWVQTTDVGRSGTPLSYAVASVDNGDVVVDNALTFSDCSGVRVYVNNEPLATDVQVADGQWHHLAFTWTSGDSGAWNLYKDGRLQSNGTNLKPTDVIQEGGTIVIGQEQDSVGGSFSPYETFTGNITRVNIWNSSFSKSNITRLCGLDDDIPGKVVAWPDFLQNIQGEVNILNDERPSLNIESFQDL